PVTPQFRTLREGDTVTIGGRRWHAFTVLGHAPEHACLFCPEANVLISGDQVLPKITTNVSVWPDQPRGNPLRLYLDSLQRFRPLPADTLVLPSHGLPFRGLHHRLDYLRQHHDERLAETVSAIAEPRTASELVPVLFRRQLDTHQLGFAIGETLAHLHYLEAEGHAERHVDPDALHHFPQPSPPPPSPGGGPGPGWPGAARPRGLRRFFPSGILPGAADKGGGRPGRQVHPHHREDRPRRCRQPVRLLVLARRVVLDIQVHRAIRI